MQEKLNQAFNTKMTKPVRFDPGALVFYKRYQPPADRKSHQDLDVPRRKVARWYGPARVLCLETRVTYHGQIRQPYNVAWIISAGRLKKVHTQQLRHASERERLIAEGSMTPSSMPWTFADLTGAINKGEFDDEIMSEKELRAEAKRQRIMQEERQRAEQGQLKRSLEETDLQPTGQAQSSTARPRLTQATEVPIETDEGDIADDEEMDSRHRVRQDLNVDDLLHDQGVQPFGEPDPAPLYRHPRQRHEHAERPHHVQRQEYLNQRGTEAEQTYFVDEPEMDEVLLNQVAEYAFAVTLPTPETEAEWRSIVKDPSKFVAKKLAKGVEVAWQKLSPAQRAAMQEAKMAEIKEWVGAKVCKAAIGPAP